MASIPESSNSPANLSSAEHLQMHLVVPQTGRVNVTDCDSQLPHIGHQRSEGLEVSRVHRMWSVEDDVKFTNMAEPKQIKHVRAATIPEIGSSVHSYITAKDETFLQSIKMRQKTGKCSWERFLNSKNEILDPEDTISRLPEAVMQHIISFLPDPDKDQIRFLSRKWRRLHMQSQTKLSLTGHKLDDQQISRILINDFPSAELLILRKCSGMKKLVLENNKLKNVEVSYCRGLKYVNLTAPNLDSFRFFGPLPRSSRIELGVCKQLMIMHLGAVILNNMMFVDCQTTFPILQNLTLSGCDITGPMNITSTSLQILSLLRIKNSVEITIDAPNLTSFGYGGSMIVPFSNMNLPNLDSARIKLDSGLSQTHDKLWYERLTEMLQGLNHTRTLVLRTNWEKNIIIPQGLRETIAPPLDGIERIVAMIKERPCNSVDVADAMLWIAPRVRNIILNLCDVNYGIIIEMGHGDYSRRLEDSCSFCSSHPIRCWRHSLTAFRLNYPSRLGRMNFMDYFLQNVQKVGRNIIHWL